ncbi:MAG: hypothetical protein JO110_06735 [Acetobacteraceae bacterium]|nr:hypothetical protein [Acetobacteraceae bacterium]
MRALFVSRESTWRPGLGAVLGILLLATVIAYAPVLVYGYPANGWDSRYHAVTARLFSDQLWSGDLYPRWLMAMNSGLGSPHFFYYSPLGYYIASAFDWFGAPTAIPQLGVAAVLLGLMSGLTCYLWLARLMPNYAAISGAVFYLASPFHVFLDLLTRADYAEFAAITFAPIVLLGIELLRERKHVGIPLMSLGFAAVVLTHVVVGLLFAGVPLVYAVARFRFLPGWLRNTFLVFLAIVIGLGIASFYLSPALAYRPDVVMPVRQMAAEMFVFGGPAQPRLILFVRLLFVGYLAVLVVMAGAWWHTYRGRPDGNLVMTCLCLALLTLGLTTIWARPLWLMLPILWTLQFSYRLFIIVDLCMAALVGWFISAMASRLPAARIVSLALFAILATAASAAAFALRFGVFEYDSQLWRERVRYTNDYGLFRPLAVRTALPADRLPLYGGGVFGPDIPLPPRTRLMEGDASVLILDWRPRRIVLQIEAQTPGRLAVGQLYVPGWQATDLSSGRTLPVLPSPGEGLLTIPFDAGLHRLAVLLIPRPPEREGAAISLLSMTLLVALTVGFGFAHADFPRGLWPQRWLGVWSRWKSP